MRLSTHARVRWAKSIVFCLVLLALLWGVDWVLRPTAAGLLPWGALDATRNEADVLVLGSSRTHTSVLPMEMWRVSGLTAVDVTAGGQNIPTTLSYLQQALESQDPKAVMVEVSMFGSRRVFRDTVTAHTNFDDMPGGMPKTTGILRSVAPTAWPELFFSLQSYHSRWVKLTAYDVLPDKREKMPWARGSLYLPDVKPLSGEPTPTTVPEATYQANLAWIREMARLCDRYGARLILFVAPSFDPAYVGDRPIVTRIESDLRAEHPRIGYLDMNPLVDAMGIDRATDYKDVAHLNHRGAVKLSTWLAGYLTREAGLPDHRRDELASHWNEALARYDEQFLSGW